MCASLLVSIIIPTYNRERFARDTLISLARQSFPMDQFEVILVDDGSTDGTKGIAKEIYPFTVRYFWQPNQGDAPARNYGALQSQADILVFLDDDILLDQNYLENLAAGHQNQSKRIVTGTAHLWLDENNSPLNNTTSANPSSLSIHTVEQPFVEVSSNNMSIRRQEYISLGMMENLGFPGSSMWCDVDFAYRAHCQGFKFVRCTEAVCWHRDYVARSITTQKKRLREAAFRAVYLFKKHPGLISYLPMFTDKTPILWSKDSPVLIVQKMRRYVLSSFPVVWVLEITAKALEQRYPASSLFWVLQRWVVGASIFHGYRQGLRKIQTSGSGV